MTKEEALYEVAKALNDFLELIIINKENLLRDLSEVEKQMALNSLGKVCDYLKIASVSVTKEQAEAAAKKLK